MGRSRKMSVTDRLFYQLDRERIWNEQGQKCYYCADPLSRAELTFDHVIPISKVGYHSVTNCVVACYDCNQAKADHLHWTPPKAELQDWEQTIVEWGIRMDERIRRFEYSFAMDTKGGYHKWVAYWKKRGKWN